MGKVSGYCKYKDFSHHYKARHILKSKKSKKSKHHRETKVKHIFTRAVAFFGFRSFQRDPLRFQAIARTKISRNNHAGSCQLEKITTTLCCYCTMAAAYKSILECDHSRADSCLLAPAQLPTPPAKFGVGHAREVAGKKVRGRRLTWVS